MLKRTFFFLPVLAMLAVLLVPSFALAANYFISSEADMIEFANSVNSGNYHYGDTYELTANITLSGNWLPLSWFDGTFDGKGYQIEYNTSGSDFAGLFYRISSYGTVKNLRVKASVSGEIAAGGIAVINYGNIEKCSFEGTVDCPDLAGGLAAANYYTGTISNCFNKGTISARYAGGLASVASEGTFTNCYNVGTVNGTYYSGLIGRAYDSTISHSFWLDTSCGAVIGYNWYSTIQNVERFDSSGNLDAPVLGQATLLDALNNHTDTWAIYDTGYNHPVFITIAASPLGLSFGSTEPGYDEPSTQTVTIVNAGENPVTLNALPESLSFTLGPLSATNLPSGDSATFTVAPKTGLPIGTYSEDLTISDSYGSAINIQVSFTVFPHLIRSVIVEGATAPVTGAFPFTLSDLIMGSSSYTALSLDWQGPSGDAAFVNGRFRASYPYTAVITLQASAGHTFAHGKDLLLVNDVYEGLISDEGMEANQMTFQMDFPVTEALAVTGIEIIHQPALLSYIEGQVLNLTGLEVRLTYSDTTTEVVGPDQFAARGITADPENGSILSMAHNGQKVSLASGGITATTDALTVAPVPTYAITASPENTAFDSLAEGYIQPEAVTITVTNTGSQSISLYQPTSAHYAIGTLSATALVPGAAAAFTIQPKAGLSLGTYNETVYLLGSMGANAQVEATFTCTVPSDEYQVTSGDGSTYQQDGSGPPSLSFTANGNINQFTGLTINGQLVDEDDYDVYEGSTIVVLHQDFLATLLPGTYTLRFHYTDGHTQASFVVQDTMPVTGDNNALYIFGALMAMCLLALWLMKTKHPLCNG